jgi:hypothetical protein
VVDRRHLLVNLSIALKRFFDCQASVLIINKTIPGRINKNIPAKVKELTIYGCSFIRIVFNPVAFTGNFNHHCMVNQAVNNGRSHDRVFSRKLSLNRVTVTRYLQIKTLPAYSPRKTGTKFTPFLDLIRRQWQPLAALSSYLKSKVTIRCQIRSQ